MERPNILILYTDQQRWDALGANGNSEIHTPNMDRLAQQGTNFDHCFVQNPVCMPSRLSLLTGQYPSTLRITHMGVPVPLDTLTLPAILSGYGYATANTGKLHFLPHANRDHRDIHPPYGFDRLLISDEPGCYDDAYRAWVRHRNPEQLDAISVGLPKAAETWQDVMGIDDGIRHPGERFPKAAVPYRGREDLTHSAFVADETMAFIRQQGHRPWLHISGFYSPHSPWIVPQRYLDLYDPETLSIPRYPAGVDAQRSADHFSDEELRAARHGYYALVSEVDHHVGRILDLLDEQGLTDRTIVVLVSDHGEWLGEHLRYGKGFPASDAISRVPLVIRGPHHLVPARRSVRTIVEAVDVLPTLLDCAGLPIPSQVQGHSLRVLMVDVQGPIRDSALMESAGWKGLRSDRYHYLCTAAGEELLFDVVDDPGEYRDLSGLDEHAMVLSDHRHQLLERLIRQERPLTRAWAY